MSQSLACIPTSWNEQPDHFLQLSPPPSIPAPPCPQYTVSRKYPKVILIFRKLHMYTFFHCTTIFSISRTLLFNNQLFKLLPTSPQQETQHYWGINFTKKIKTIRYHCLPKNIVWIRNILPKDMSEKILWLFLLPWFLTWFEMKMSQWIYMAPLVERAVPILVVEPVLVGIVPI